jgi:hypothetical protein
MLRRLPHVKKTPYVVLLQRRISAVCRGHIRWLEWVRKPWLSLDRTESLLGSGCFAANYWVNGQIMPKGSGSWQPDDAITDTPFQILKVTAYVKWLQTLHQIDSLEDQRLRHYMALLRDVWAYLIPELDDLDKRKACAWRHASEDGLNIYRLDDHVWLWNSLNELHDLDMWSLTEESSRSWGRSPGRWIFNIYSLPPTAKLGSKDSMIDWKDARNRELSADFVSKARRLLPKEVQSAVLQRFTVENDVSQERMLAVTRSARETRFYFHTRDTALFYGHMLKFFRPDTSFSELWERTIECQGHHEEAPQGDWHSPLRFVLGALAGLNGFAIDKRSPEKLIRHSVEALIQVSAHNAFIPGEIDVATRKPSIFSGERDRDYYYHVGFETCQILSKHARVIDVAFRSEQIGSHNLASQQNERNGQIQREMIEALLKEMLVQPKKRTLINHPYRNDYRALAKLFEADGRLDRKRTSMVMKRSMPFNSMIDVSSITNMDEEWLYNYPDFLLVDDIDLIRELESFFDRDSNRYMPVYESPSSIIDKALESLGGIPPETFSFTTVKTDGKLPGGFVASLPKQKSLVRRQKRGKRAIGANVAYLFISRLNGWLWDSIKEARSALNAKKRFLWLPSRSDSKTALLCWLASTERERPAISLFFDRHAEYDNQLWDDTTMALNTWQTELHLCFWVLFDKSQHLHAGIPHPLEAPWPRDSTKELRRASIGFRFDGDLFDRYWTCHFLQYVPGLSSGFSGIPREWMSRFRNEKQFWQRKVLELQLLQYMLNLILTSSGKILKGVETELGLKKGKLVFSVLTTEAYSLSADHWQIYEELLEKAEEDITSSLNTLSKWATREEDRGQERPRWTRDDERKYRGYINKLRNQTERQRWDLESSRDKICKLRETLTTRQSKLRSDLEAKREQNIRYFTYVTVIFLPLGFASSFYSMNGAPNNDLIVSLVKFSAAAFAVTGILLFSATLINNVMLPLQRYSLDTRKQSLLFRGTSIDNKPEDKKMLPKAYSKTDWMVSSWFWPAYLILELPTCTISSAWTAIGTGILSASAVWRVALGIVVLPIYVISQAVLILFGNTVLLLRISSEHMISYMRKMRVHLFASRFRY